MTPSSQSEAVPLDRYERRILRALQVDGRLTNQDLARQVGLSPSACWRRVKALEDAGVILRYTAILDPAKVGVGETVFAHVSMAHHSKNSSAEFAELMRQRPEVMECFFTTGAADIVLRVATPGVAAYDRFLENVIFNAPAVSQVHSDFALRKIKFETALPL
ncbi:MAG: Lrp/AsnC family transcriptional regulator [Gammaproteobacteria bacterium]|nr:MAG: Lrp/AsnC family transcriptional regulator [Gammaproteobacteria bacterium]